VGGITPADATVSYMGAIFGKVRVKVKEGVKAMLLLERVHMRRLPLYNATYANVWGTLHWPVHRAECPREPWSSAHHHADSGLDTDMDW
jgi:hypothetical protein